MNPGPTDHTSVRQWFGAYGPNLLALGIIVALALTAAEATGVVTDLLARSVIGLTILATVTPALTGFLKRTLFTVIGRVAGPVAGAILKGNRVRSMLTTGAALLVGGLLAAVVAVGIRAMDGVADYAFFAGALVVAGIGLTGQIAWYRSSVRAWQSLNP
jgi:hypothetical protein